MSRMSSLSHFLLKSHEFLYGRRGIRLNILVSLSTSLWRRHLRRLGHSQNSMELLMWWLKKLRRSDRIAADWTRKGWTEGLKILLTAWIESVMTMILEILLMCIAWLIPHLMVNSSASVLVILIAWWIVLISGLSWVCIWAIVMECFGHFSWFYISFLLNFFFFLVTMKRHMTSQSHDMIS